MRRALFAGMLVLGACRGAGKQPAAKAHDAAVAAAPAPAPVEVDAAWPVWTAAAAAFVEPPPGTPPFGLVVVEISDGEVERADPAQLEALRAHVAANRDAIRTLGQAARATPCRAGAGDPSIGLYNVTQALLARAVLAGADGDFDEAVADIVTALTAARALTRCGGGMLYASVATGAEGELMEIARALAPRLDPGGTARKVLARAVEAHAIPREVIAQALEVDAPSAGDSLAAVAISHATLAEAVVVAARRARGARSSPIDPAALAPLIELFGRHAAVLVREDANAAAADGYHALADTIRRYAAHDPPLATGVMGRRRALLDELGVAAVVIEDPESLRAPIDPAVERAFLASENPVGRVLAAELIMTAASHALLLLDGMRTAAEAREALLGELREPDSGAY